MIRIGILANDKTISFFEYTILKEVLKDKDFEFVAVIENEAKKNSFRRNFKRRRRNYVWKRLNKIERKISLRKYGKIWSEIGFSPVDRVPIAKLGKKYDLINVMPKVSKSGYIHRFKKEDVDKIKALKLDVILRFGFNILYGKVLTSAKHGIWSYHHADNSVNRGVPPGFWEVALKSPYTGVTLQVLTEDLDNGIVLKKGFYPTYFKSWNENKRRIYWDARFLMIDTLLELKNKGTIIAHSEVENAGFNVYDKPLYMAPRTSVLGSLVLRMCYERSVKFLKSLIYKKQWILLFTRNKLNGLSLWKMKKIIPPSKKVFWADPFSLTHKGANWVFFEEFEYSKDKGRIACIRINKSSWDTYKVAIDLPYHLSYPFIFKHDKGIYMIPESHQNNTIELWECVNFPDTWSLKKVIFNNISAVDTTLLEYDGFWWMFTNVDRSGFAKHHSELFIYYTDDPINGTWQAHTKNPIMSDARFARMGGGFLTSKNGNPIRFGQITSPEYGTGLQYFELLELTPDRYKEVKIQSLVPNWNKNVVGMHHCHSTDHLTVMDAQIMVRK